MDIFITGDRSMHPVVAVGLVIEALKTEVFETVSAVATGSLEFGVERAVRYLVPRVDELHYSTQDDGHVDFDRLFEIVGRTFDKVMFIHTDPLSSRIGASLVKNVPADKLIFYPEV